MAAQDGAAEPLVRDAENKIKMYGRECIYVSNDSIYAITLTRPESLGGRVNMSADRKKPYDDAKAIFYGDEAHLDALKGKESCKEETYQEVVRAKMLTILRSSGLKVESYETTDKDEVILLIKLGDKGLQSGVVHEMAARQAYPVPLKEKTYTDLLRDPNSGVKKNADGYEVKAVVTYEEEVDDMVEDFREVDAIRLVINRLHNLMHFSRLVQDQVIVCNFPLVDQDFVKKGDNEWVFRCGLGAADPHLVRNYFGEDIAFFFSWLENYVKSMWFVAIVGVGLFIQPFVYDFEKENEHKMQVVFSWILVAWAALSVEFSKSHLQRTQQLWGMQDYSDSASVDRASYRPDLENTWRLSAQKWAAKAIQGGFIAGFMCALAKLQAVQRQEKEEGNYDSPLIQYGSMITVVVIKIAAQIWSRLAPVLANMENPRTESRYEEKLTEKLVGMHLFVSLWSFVYLAFVKPLIPVTCQDSVEDAAVFIWNMTKEDIHDRAPGAIEHLNNSYTRVTRNGTRFCIRGCYPAVPEDSVYGGVTTCYTALQTNLSTYFILSVITAVLLMVVVPVATVYYQIYSDQQKLKKADPGKKPQLPTDLQVQSDSFASVRYGYREGGGSKIEDFLEFAVGFALLSSFGILCPVLVPVGFIANAIMYKLLAYRMVHVTSRPYPATAAGIGLWADVMETIAKIAIVTNTAMAVFNLYPMREWDWKTKFVCFIVLEHGLLFLNNMIDAIIPPTPPDVRQIEDHNAKVLRYLASSMAKPLKVTASFETKDINTGMTGQPKTGGIDG